MTQLQPALRILAVIREQLTEALLDEGISEECISQMDSLAVQFWTHSTLDVVFAEARDILPRHRFLKVLTFTNREYSLVYTALPENMRSAACIEHNTVHGSQ